MHSRFATFQDIPAVCELLKQFSSEARVGFRPWSTEQDTPRIFKLVTRWQQDHYVRVAVRDTEIVGTRNQDCDQYLAQGRVQAVLLSTQGPDTNFDPGRRGWKLIEQTWMKEA